MTVKRVLGIDLGGASSRTTGFVVLEGDERPGIISVGRADIGATPYEAEQALLDLVDQAKAAAVAIDAPLTLPPCLTCPRYCRGPGPLCELEAARSMWRDGHNPVSQRPCEVHIINAVGERPMPTMQLGVITARAVALARRLAARGVPPSFMERGEILEVYPRATLRRLSDSDPKAAPRQTDETPEDYRARVLGALPALIDGLDDHDDTLANPHAFDALVASYTGWLGPERLASPPPDFNVASGWIWYPENASSDRA